MRRFVMILIGLFILSITIPALVEAGEDVYININDLSGLTPSAQQELISKKLRDAQIVATGAKGVLAKIDPDSAEKWAKLISGTIKTVCKDLAIEVNEFVKTDVGKITLALIAYKIVGEDVLGIVFGVGGWLVVMAILFFTFRHFHGSSKIVKKDDKGNVTDISYVPKYDWILDSHGDSAAKVVSVVVHVLIFIAITIAALCMAA